MRTSVIALALASAPALAACGIDQPPSSAPAVFFEMYYGNNYDPGPFDDAWNAARADPSVGVAYDFPVLTTDIPAGAEVRLVAGRLPAGDQIEATGDGDLIFEVGAELATVTVGEDERVTFPHFAVHDPYVLGSMAIPSALLCGTTVFAARAYEHGHGTLPSSRWLATAWFLAVTPPCDP